MIDKSIFREYDIRGIVPDQINELSVKAIANAIATKCNHEQVDEVALGIAVLGNQCIKYRNCYKSPAVFCSKENKI